MKMMISRKYHKLRFYLVISVIIKQIFYRKKVLSNTLEVVPEP